MNKFDEDLYEFITTPDNFEASFEIANKFEVFKKKIIEDFWQKVIENIELNIQLDKRTELKDWIISDENIIVNNGCLGIYNDKYCSEKLICTSVETCFQNWSSGNIVVGLYFNSQEKIKGLNKNNIIAYCKKNVSNDWKLSSPTYDLPIYKRMKENFNSYDTLRKILPSEGDFLAKEYAQTLIDTHIELYPLIEKFGVKFK